MAESDSYIGNSDIENNKRGASPDTMILYHGGIVEYVLEEGHP